MVVKKIRVLGPQETLIHAAPEVCCNDCYNRPCVESFCAAAVAVLRSPLCAVVVVLRGDRSAVLC